MTILEIAFLVLLIYLMIGAFVCFFVDTLSNKVIEPREFLAILLFYPIVGLIMSIMGMISLLSKHYKELEKDLGEDSEE